MSSNERRTQSASENAKSSPAMRRTLLAAATGFIGGAAAIYIWIEPPAFEADPEKEQVHAVSAFGTEASTPRIAVGQGATSEEGARGEVQSPAALPAGSATARALAPFVPGSPRFGGVPEDAARAIVESVSRHHELAQLLRSDPRAPASTRACVDFLFAVWPEIDALIEKGLVEVEVHPVEGRGEVSGRRVAYTKGSTAKTLAVAIWHERWSCSIRFSAGGSAQEAFENLFVESDAGGDRSGR